MYWTERFIYALSTRGSVNVALSFADEKLIEEYQKYEGYAHFITLLKDMRYVSTSEIYLQPCLW